MYLKIWSFRNQVVRTLDLRRCGPSSLLGHSMSVRGGQIGVGAFFVGVLQFYHTKNFSPRLSPLSRHLFSLIISKAENYMPSGVVRFRL